MSDTYLLNLYRLDEKLQSFQFKSTNIDVHEWTYSSPLQYIQNKADTKPRRKLDACIKRLDWWIDELEATPPLIKESNHSVRDIDVKPGESPVQGGYDVPNKDDSVKKMRKMKEKIRSLSFSKTKTFFFTRRDEKRTTETSNVRNNKSSRNAFRKASMSKSITNMSNLFTYTKGEEMDSRQRKHPHTVHTIRKAFHQTETRNREKNENCVGGQSWNSQYYKFEYV